MSNTNWLTPNEVAKQLQVCYETIRRWLESGKLKGYKMGKQWRIKESDLGSFPKPNIKE